MKREMTLNQWLELEIRELVELSQITLNALNEEIQIYLENKKESEGK